MIWFFCGVVVGFFGMLAGAGPKTAQTPYEYAHSLERWLPRFKGEVWTITDSYVKRKYGKKETTSEYSINIGRALLSLRFFTLIRIIRLTR